MRRISGVLWLAFVASALLWPLRLGGGTSAFVPRRAFNPVFELRVPAAPAVQGFHLVTEAPIRAERLQQVPPTLALPGYEALQLRYGRVGGVRVLAAWNQVTLRNGISYFPTGPPALT